MVRNNPLEKKDLLKSILQFASFRKVIQLSCVSSLWNSVSNDIRFHPTKVEMKISDDGVMKLCFDPGYGSLENESILDVNHEWFEIPITLIPVRIIPVIKSFTIEGGEDIHEKIQNIYFPNVNRITLNCLEDDVIQPESLSSVCNPKKVSELWLREVDSALAPFINLFPNVSELELTYDYSNMHPLDLNDVYMDSIQCVKTQIENEILFRNKVESVELRNFASDFDGLNGDLLTPENFRGVETLLLSITASGMPPWEPPNPELLQNEIEARLEELSFLEEIVIDTSGFEGYHVSVIPRKPSWAENEEKEGFYIYYN